MDVRVRRGLVALAAVLLLWLLVAVFQVMRAAGDLTAARDALGDVEDAVLVNDLAAAAEQLDRASAEFASARARLGGAGTLPVRVAPVVGRNARVLRHLSVAGERAARAGHIVAAAIADLPGGVNALAPAGGALPLEAYDALIEPVRHADALLAGSVREVEQTVGVPVLDRIDAVRQQALELMPGAADAVHRATVMLPVLDDLLGAEQPRRYLFVAQNPAELRGTGGFIGAYSILTLHQGRFSFSAFNEIHDLPAFPVGDVVPPSAEFAARYNRHGGAGFWHNINMTPDFPTAARAMEALYAKGTGDEVDGVIAVDPFALEALLKVSGPVRVPGFGDVGADEVVDVVSNRAHDEIRDSEARKALLGTVAVGAFEGFLAAEGAKRPLETAATLSDVMREGHLLLRSSDPRVQAALLTAGVAGELTDPPWDFAAVIANAGSAAKLDYYMERSVAYDVHLAADGSATATLETTFANAAPTTGVSTRVIGPNVKGLEAGEQRLVVSMYAPEDAVVDAFSRTRGNRPAVVHQELGHTVFETVIEIPGGESESLTVSWARSDAWQEVGDGGRYRLTVRGQPTLRPTIADLAVSLPPGVVVTAATPGMQQHADSRITYTGPLNGSLDVDIAFAPEQRGGLWPRIRRWWSQPLLSR